MEQQAQAYAVAQVVPEHLAQLRDPKLALIAKTEAAVKDRLTKEISYWDHRAEQLKLQEKAGASGARSTRTKLANGPIRCRPGCTRGYRNCNLKHSSRRYRRWCSGAC